MSCLRKTFEEDMEHDFSFRSSTTAVVILRETPIQTSNRPQMTPFNPFIEEEDEIEPVPSPLSLPRKKRSILPKGASFSGTQHTPRLRPRAIIAKTNELMKGVYKLLRAKRTPGSVDPDVTHSSDDTLDSYLLARVWQSAMEVWTHAIDEERSNTIWFPSYYLKMVNLETFDSVTSFFDATLIPLDHRAHVFISRKEALYVRNMVWRAANVNKSFQPVIFDGENAVKEV